MGAVLAAGAAAEADRKVEVARSVVCSADLVAKAAV